ncbi:cell division protein FtsQ [Sphingobacterium pedocola]|uniref:Cell division protein FtsQ n=1 Tax=Sphingobacterium pedocola TaxID=2082722 RepID=A0ABR9T2F3_9SPHI|nr:cell division protein FtsQ [Sphingobacterium pedocola]MBE8719518.1 cell division protein FtsQ [Sphingobacterium pedocola]
MNRVKNIRWSFIGYGILGVAVLVGLTLLMSLIARKSNDQVCIALRVMIEGKETFIDQHDISNLINEKYGRVVGRTIKGIPVNQIEESLKDLPYVSNAEIHTDMDGVMQVAVQQREVVLRVINKNGREFYIDREGKKIPVTLKYVPHVLVANGNISESYGRPLDDVQSKLVSDLVKIVDHIRGDELWENQIVQLYVNAENDIEIVPRVGNEELIIGTADSLDYKLDRLKIYYREILPKVGNDAYARVNVKYGDQIICERRGDWFMDSLQMKINMKN